VRRFAMTLTTALAGTAAVATTAEAQTFAIAPVKPCYLGGDVVTGTGTAFTPMAPVDIAADGTSLGQVSADAAGGFVTPAITLGGMRGVKSHTLTATDQTNPALTATVTFMGTTNTVSVKPASGRAGTPRRLKGYGFTAGPKVYMHVRRRGYKTDARIAKAKAPCGTFVVRKTIVPAGAGDGKYKVQFDSQRRYSKRTRPRFVGVLTIFHTARSSAARVAFARR
jgi:hypothetical protein